VSAGPRSYKTSAVVLRGRNYGEADRILTLFSTQHGKMDAIAKGARRTKSHLAGRLEFGNEVLLGMHRGRNLDVIVSADIEAAHWAQLVEPERFAAASIVIELVDAFCEPDLAQPEIYALLTAALTALARSKEPLALLPRFEMRLLHEMGLAPRLDACMVCGRALDGGALDVEQGGVACARCAGSWRSALHLDEADFLSLRALAATQKTVVRATSRAAAAVDALVAHHLGRKPKAGAHALEFVRER
jgi:DNA repair protein RecO (recombination protein O)